MTLLQQIIWEGRELFTGMVPEEKRLHPEFMVFDGDHWYMNAPARRFSSYDFDKSLEKVRILLNDEDLSKLDGIPFISKLALSKRHDDSYKYCLVVMPQPDSDTAEDILKWAESRGLSAVSLIRNGR
ncbi:MAG: hypothetical protein KGQ41_06135 [Alphaproteobacteria bacterium]|nr:hypothetical protein [Alphaproteobacteria bacterium]